MTDQTDRRIGAYYDVLVDRFGHDPRACDYGNEKSQAIKFRTLAGVGNLDGRSILDVGCGFADYADYLEQRFRNVRYTGLDLSRRMVESARARRPDLELHQGNLLDWDPPGSYDVVNANGIFYLLGENARERMLELVRRMFDVSTHAVAFNSLSTWASIHEPDEFYADPSEMVEACRRISPWVVLRHDYLPHDFTIYLYRDRPD